MYKEHLILHIGSNLGDKKHNLAYARQLIEENLSSIDKISSIYITQAWGVEDQDDFYNLALSLKIKMNPHEILKITKNIEKIIGRNKTKKWGPRIIDIDILFYEDQIINTDELIIPHPHLQDRRFVLDPLSEILPDFIHPKIGKKILTLQSITNDKLSTLILDE